MNILLQTIRDEDGKIQNIINHKELLMENNGISVMPDVYLCFLLKTIIDDFGEFLTTATKNKINKEQFEATIISNLIQMIPDKTRE
jgi:hypothetical protein